MLELTFAPMSGSVLITNGMQGWIEFDVTSDVQTFLSGTANYGWLIKKTNENQLGLVEFDSRDSLSDTPILEITFAP